MVQIPSHGGAPLPARADPLDSRPMAAAAAALALRFGPPLPREVRWDRCVTADAEGRPAAVAGAQDRLLRFTEPGAEDAFLRFQLAQQRPATAAALLAAGLALCIAAAATGVPLYAGPGVAHVVLAAAAAVAAVLEHRAQRRCTEAGAAEESQLDNAPLLAPAAEAPPLSERAWRRVRLVFYDAVALVATVAWVPLIVAKDYVREEGCSVAAAAAAVGRAEYCDAPLSPLPVLFVATLCLGLRPRVAYAAVAVAGCLPLSLMVGAVVLDPRPVARTVLHAVAYVACAVAALVGAWVAEQQQRRQFLAYAAVHVRRREALGSTADVVAVLRAAVPPVALPRVLQAASLDDVLAVDSAAAAAIGVAAVHDYARWSTGLLPARVVQVLHALYCSFDEAVARFGVVKAALHADTYVVCCGLGDAAASAAAATVPTSAAASRRCSDTVDPDDGLGAQRAYVRAVVDMARWQVGPAVAQLTVEGRPALHAAVCCGPLEGAIAGFTAMRYVLGGPAFTAAMALVHRCPAGAVAADAAAAGLLTWEHPTTLGGSMQIASTSAVTPMQHSVALLTASDTDAAYAVPRPASAPRRPMSAQGRRIFRRGSEVLAFGGVAAGSHLGDDSVDDLSCSDVESATHMAAFHTGGFAGCAAVLRWRGGALSAEPLPPEPRPVREFGIDAAAPYPAHHQGRGEASRRRADPFQQQKQRPSAFVPAGTPLPLPGRRTSREMGMGHRGSTTSGASAGSAPLPPMAPTWGAAPIPEPVLPPLPADAIAGEDRAVLAPGTEDEGLRSEAVTAEAFTQWVATVAAAVQQAWHLRFEHPDMEALWLAEGRAPHPAPHVAAAVVIAVLAAVLVVDGVVAPEFAVGSAAAVAGATLLLLASLMAAAVAGLALWTKRIALPAVLQAAVLLVAVGGVALAPGSVVGGDPLAAALMLATAVHFATLPWYAAAPAAFLAVAVPATLTAAHRVRSVPPELLPLLLLGVALAAIARFRDEAAARTGLAAVWVAERLAGLTQHRVRLRVALLRLLLPPHIAGGTTDVAALAQYARGASSPTDVTAALLRAEDDRRAGATVVAFLAPTEDAPAPAPLAMEASAGPPSPRVPWEHGLPGLPGLLPGAGGPALPPLAHEDDTAVLALTVDMPWLLARHHRGGIGAGQSVLLTARLWVAVTRIVEHVTRGQMHIAESCGDTILAAGPFPGDGAWAGADRDPDTDKARVAHACVATVRALARDDVTGAVPFVAVLTAGFVMAAAVGAHRLTPRIFGPAVRDATALLRAAPVGGRPCAFAAASFRRMYRQYAELAAKAQARRDAHRSRQRDDGHVQLAPMPVDEPASASASRALAALGGSLGRGATSGVLGPSGRVAGTVVGPPRPPHEDPDVFAPPLRWRVRGVGVHEVSVVRDVTPA